MPATAGSSIFNGWMLRRRGGWNRHWRASARCLRHRPASSTRTPTCNACWRMRSAAAPASPTAPRSRRCDLPKVASRYSSVPMPSRRCGLAQSSTRRGLEAHHVAASIEGFPRQHIPKIFYGKGSYFELTGKSPFARLIYPAPPTSGGHLGIHMTLDLSGAARFGPDLEWVDCVDYRVEPSRAAAFGDAIKEYWPQLEAASLKPAYAGVRPKLSG